MRHISSKQIRNTGGIVLTKQTITSDEFTDTPSIVQRSDLSRPISTVSTTVERVHLHREPSSGGSSQVFTEI